MYVVDVNYYPGFEKLPQYEELMVEFLVCQLEGGGRGKGGRAAGGGGGGAPAASTAGT